MNLTLGEALRFGTSEIGRRDAMLLLCFAAGKTEADILLHGGELLPSEEYFSLVSRCKNGEPVQYIIGTWDFFGRTFRVDKRALIPRPETELLVEQALFFLVKAIDSKYVLDLCTGSGCIAASIAAAGHYNVTAADISPEALSLATENGEGLGINFVLSDLFENIAGTFDVIVSNPPYITAEEMVNLSPTVAAHEPHLALFGGTDGMDIYRKLIPQSLKFLKPGGVLLLEIGPKEVKDIMVEAGFKDVTLKNDYAGLPRIVYGVR